MFLHGLVTAFVKIGCELSSALQETFRKAFRRDKYGKSPLASVAVIYFRMLGQCGLYDDFFEFFIREYRFYTFGGLKMPQSRTGTVHFEIVIIVVRGRGVEKFHATVLVSRSVQAGMCG